jgi:release factor glutamine methyltransferase
LLLKHTSYNELYKYGCDLLKKADIDDAALDARLLLEYVCKTDINDLYTHGDRDVSPEDEQSYEELIKERASNIPLQYITGVQDFMGLDFKVTKDVLVPRQDTEVLVEEAMKSLHDGMRVLDMCTGSGCILISLLHYSNDCSGIGIDISSCSTFRCTAECGQIRCDRRGIY